MTAKQRPIEAGSCQGNPPPYSNSDFVSAYVATRPPPAKMATHSVATHQLRLGDRGDAAGAALYFPQPENVWLSRDVDHEDWETFTAHLNAAAAANSAGIAGAEAEAEAEDQVARRQDAIKCISQWNRNFFAPRSLRVLPLFADQDPSLAAEAYLQEDAVSAAVGAGPGEGGDTTGEDQRRGYGIKLGKNSMLGLALPPHSNGFGLRVGGVLLGVQIGDKKN